MYSLKRTVAPTSEPVTLSQAKAQCRLDQVDSSEDALLVMYIQAAREYVEEQTGRSLIAQTWVLTRDRFPGYTTLFRSSGPWALPADCGKQHVNEILLGHGPVLSVSSVTFYDGNNSPETLDPALYVADLSGDFARVAPAPGCWWPVAAWRPDAVQVTYSAGYGATAGAVPATLQLAMLLLVAHWYENREATQAAISGNGPMPLPLGVESLLVPHTSLCLTLET